VLTRLPWRKPKLRIFLNYRKADAGGYAIPIYHSLVSKFGSSQVFKDVDAIKPGEQWDVKLNETLSTCDVVVAVIGPDWLSAADETGRRLDRPDDWVRRELEQALKREVPIVPTLVGGATLPNEAQLPETLRPLLRRQMIELHDATWNSDLKRMVKALREFAERLRDPATAQDVGAVLNDVLKRWQQVPRRARMTVLVVVGGLVVILLGVGFVIHWLLIGAAIAALVWLIAKFMKNTPR